MSGWESFFVTEASAAAVLAGLIFVSVSINLKEIVTEPDLPSRALEALVLLLGVLFAASLLLLPNQDLRLGALEVGGIGVLMWGAVSWLQWTNRSPLRTQHRHSFIVRVVLSQAATLPFILAGILMAARGVDALYWIVPGVLISFFVALMDAWVLLVEIQR